MKTDCTFNDDDVTPHVGVWIETLYLHYHSLLEAVTPHVGVWIETLPRLRNGYNA